MISLPLLACFPGKRLVDDGRDCRDLALTRFVNASSAILKLLLTPQRGELARVLVFLAFWRFVGAAQVGWLRGHPAGLRCWWSRFSSVTALRCSGQGGAGELAPGPLALMLKQRQRVRDEAHCVRPPWPSAARHQQGAPPDAPSAPCPTCSWRAQVLRLGYAKICALNWHCQALTAAKRLQHRMPLFVACHQRGAKRTESVLGGAPCWC